MNRNKFDVTVSVWNDFHAPELCEGLARNSIRVLALRSRRSSLNGLRTKRSLTAMAFTHLYYRFGDKTLIENAQNSFEKFALRNTGQSKIFWGWNGHHLEAFKEAKRKNQFVICECGSSHSLWAAEKLSSIHRQLGVGPTNLTEGIRERNAAEEYALADRIAAPSNFVKTTLIQYGIDPAKIFINPYGIDEDFWGRVSGARRNAGPLIFVFTASLSPRKGVHILLRAWDAANLRDAELWLCGQPQMPFQRDLHKFGKNVKMLGLKSHNELLSIYNRASIYVLPSFEEGMARSGIEAMASGLPLIITNETGLTDLISPGRHGWVVPSGSIEALAAALRDASETRDSLPQKSVDTQSLGLSFTKTAYGNRAANFAKDLL